MRQIRIEREKDQKCQKQNLKKKLQKKTVYPAFINSHLPIKKIIFLNDYVHFSVAQNFLYMKKNNFILKK